MTKRQMAYLACTAAVTASLLGAAPSAEHQTVHWVKPGGSIQKAVNSAHSGDTVVLSPGTYHESVRITVSNLTLRGYGARSTVIVPGKASGSCAKAGNGICVTGTDKKRVKGVTVSSLTLRGFAKQGLWASGTDRLTVQGVVAEKNGQWGIAQERSVRGAFRYNLARNNGDAGLFLSNTVSTEEGARDAQGTVVSHNLLSGNRIGVTVRRLRNLTVDHNEATGNCAAVFVVGDENKPHVGALSVVRNYIHANNKFCPKTPRLPFLQGSGIVLTGAEKTLVAENRVEDNVGTSPLSGGIVLYKSFVGAVNEHNEIRNNVAQRNGKADLANRDRAKGKRNTFHGNTCTHSEPAGLC
ncbi:MULTISPECIES: right-handed parallel beta-helix repeat-containing protein [Streptomyces]|jgi:nitrous oxidase accessory protein NosD|uniref:right-handed parallel beta-helix repeat-containing protein n=1 Tax=Streptomyces TaxID=1883 RepID=UPI000BB1550D|nr:MULTISPECIES: right-handed parallel beta-helix repeat-containing protein [unclassified Streptomyces]